MGVKLFIPWQGPCRPEPLSAQNQSQLRLRHVTGAGASVPLGAADTCAVSRGLQRHWEQMEWWLPSACLTVCHLPKNVRRQSVTARHWFSLRARKGCSVYLFNIFHSLRIHRKLFIVLPSKEMKGGERAGGRTPTLPILVPGWPFVERQSEGTKPRVGAQGRTPALAQRQVASLDPSLFVFKIRRLN